MKFPIEKRFTLSSQFLEKYKTIKPNFGFNGLGEFVFMRTYSRIKEDGQNEAWWEVVKRVVEGAYSIQRQHIEDYGLGWNQYKAQKSAQTMYDIIFNLKMLVSGRALWTMGTPLIMDKGLIPALFNCGFLSTENIKEDVGLPFANGMDFLMCGVGIGFDTLGAGKVLIQPQKEKEETFVIPDSREGWVDSLHLLINSFFGGKKYVFDYSEIRPEGAPIKTFGGTSSGYKPLKELHDKVYEILSNNIEKEITVRIITDIFNLVGKAVVSGNVRRSAELALGENDEEFLNLKNYNLNPDRIDFGWASNNSVSAKIGMDYSGIAERIKDNAEPGLVWLDNFRSNGRMGDGNKNDHRIMGVNPCVVGETEILTKKGYEQIQDLVDQETEIWNGFEWSLVIPKITGKNQEVITVSLSDGRSLTCTPYHKFYIADGYSGKSIEKEAKDLEVGDKLIKHDFPILEFEKSLDHPYTNGFVSAEGMELNRTFYLYYPKEMCFDRITNKRSFKKEENSNRYKIILDSVPVSKSFVPIEYNLNSRLEWLAGLFDGDGTELKEGGLQLCSVNPVFLRDLQKLLSTLGIQSKIVPANEEGMRYMPDHKGGNKEYFCKKSERICIGAVQMQQLISLGLKCERLSFNKNPQRDASQFSYVIDITESGVADTVYCFNEPKNHTGIFNGIITGQCGEIGLESSELCVSGDTRILTKNGYPKIKNVLGEDVEVWNGLGWSYVKPFKTGSDKSLLRIHFSDGSYLDCTPEHRFSIETSRHFGVPKLKEVEAKELSLGDKLEFLETDGSVDGTYDENAFEWGFFAGDGYLDGKYINAVVCGNKSKLETLGMKGRFGVPQEKDGYSEPVNRVYLTDTLKDFETAKDLNNKDIGIPEYFFNLDKKSTLEFVAGWIESDGTIQKNIGSYHYRIYGSYQKMIDLQLILRRAGINHTTVSLASQKGHETNFGKRNRDLFYITIPSSECSKISNNLRLKKISKDMASSGFTDNRAYEKSEKIKKTKRQKVIGVEKLNGVFDTFCFTEPSLHKGVFGNVLTHQCNLVETFPNNHENLEDYKTTIKYAYLFAKTITLLNTHWQNTNRVMLRNRRIGLSVTGVTQFIAKNGLDTLKMWLEEAYNLTKYYDEVYSDWFAIPESIKITTAKPSGTLSLLAGATPGIHFPESQYYIRRVRLANNSPFIPILEASGYTVEPAFGQEESTSVVDFPVFIGENVKTINDVSMWEQLALASFIQKYWADNSVSVTVTFKPHEAKDIESALSYYQYQLKAVSFLPKYESTAYPQMPYEEITKEKYEEMKSKLEDIDFSQLLSYEGEGEKYCSNEGCLV